MMSAYLAFLIHSIQLTHQVILHISLSHNISSLIRNNFILKVEIGVVS